MRRHKFLLSDVGDGVGTRASVVGVFGVADRLARPPLEWHPFFLLEASTNSMAEEYSKGFGQGNCFRKGHVLAVIAVRSTLLLLSYHTIPTIFHFRSAEIMGDSHLLILIVCARRRGGFVCFAGGTFYFCTDESKSKQILL